MVPKCTQTQPSAAFWVSTMHPSTIQGHGFGLGEPMAAVSQKRQYQNPLVVGVTLTPFPRRGGRTFPDRERRARNSLKSPHNSREWLPGRRGVAAVRLRRRPGSGSRPELFWPWPAKGAASAPFVRGDSEEIDFLGLALQL